MADIEHSIQIQRSYKVPTYTMFYKTIIIILYMKFRRFFRRKLNNTLRFFLGL